MRYGQIVQRYWREMHARHDHPYHHIKNAERHKIDAIQCARLEQPRAPMSVKKAAKRKPLFIRTLARYKSTRQGKLVRRDK